jgi:hypothetical protein
MKNKTYHIKYISLDLYFLVFMSKVLVHRSSFNGAFPPKESDEFNCDVIYLQWCIYTLKGMFAFLWYTCMANFSSIAAKSSREQILKL